MLAVAALGSYEHELRVTQNVVVCATDSMFGCSYQQVAVVVPWLPPHG